MFSISQEPRGSSPLVWLCFGISMVLLTEGLIRSVQNFSATFGGSVQEQQPAPSIFPAAALSQLGLALFLFAMAELVPADPKQRTAAILYRVSGIVFLLLCTFSLFMQGVELSILVGLVLTVAFALIMRWRLSKLPKP